MTLPFLRTTEYFAEPRRRPVLPLRFVDNGYSHLSLCSHPMTVLSKSHHAVRDFPSLARGKDTARSRRPCGKSNCKEEKAVDQKKSGDHLSASAHDSRKRALILRRLCADLKIPASPGAMHAPQYAACFQRAKSAASVATDPRPHLPSNCPKEPMPPDAMA